VRARGQDLRRGSIALLAVAVALVGCTDSVDDVAPFDLAQPEDLSLPPDLVSQRQSCAQLEMCVFSCGKATDDVCSQHCLALGTARARMLLENALHCALDACIAQAFAPRCVDENDTSPACRNCMLQNIGSGMVCYDGGGCEECALELQLCQNDQ
jgi:hypothetical protein